MPLDIQLLIVALPFGAAFLTSMLLAPSLIASLRRWKVGQTISADGPESHRSKAGTPTMGGLIIIAGFLVGAVATVLIVVKSGAHIGGIALYEGMIQDVLAVVLLVGAFAALGMADDYLTVHPVRGVRGIASKPKAAAQVLLAIAFVMWLANNRPGGFQPILFVAQTQVLSGWIYYAFAVIFIVGMANFVNITDGLDGLVGGLAIIASAGFWFVMLLTGGVAGTAVGGLLLAIAGACLAFLWFNTNPAKVFMGDTGSLALGVALPAIAILAHREALLIIVGLVFILDGLSSALQWAVFKYTRIRTGTGRRVFKKSPIHHHFELSGWPEQMIVVRFWIVGVIAALIALIGAAWRLW